MMNKKGRLLCKMAATIYAPGGMAPETAVGVANQIYNRVQEQIDAERAAVEKRLKEEHARRMEKARA